MKLFPRTRLLLLTGSVALIALLSVSAALAFGSSFVENWNAATSPYFILLGFNRSKAISNVASVGASDGKALQLQLSARPRSGPGGGAEVETTELYSYGTYTTRLKTLDCSAQPKAGVVTGYFTYFNDGTDLNSNGLPDNSEIDFEWLCAEPEVIYLTAWTDYRDSDTLQKRVGRGINLRTGQILYTCYFEQFGLSNCQPLSGAENMPSSIAPLTNYNSAAAYYEYGFTWTASRITWWIVNPADGSKITLWDYQGPASRIPNRPAYYMTNVWYTSGWSPLNDPTAVEKPTKAFSAFVDWTRFLP